MFEWDNIRYAALILIIILMLVGYLALEFWKKKTQKTFADSHLFAQLVTHNSNVRYWIRVSLLLMALFFLTLAIMGPQRSNEVSQMKREGIDMVFALDVSRSMDCEDMPPSRLIKGKKIIRDLTEELAGDRVGLVAYAGVSNKMLGLTEDYTAVQLMLDAVNSDMTSMQGTSLADAINKALNTFDPNTGGDKAIILITDGEDHEENIDEALDRAKSMKINIITVGVGTESGGKIPVFEEGVKIGYKQDGGSDVITKLDEKTLKNIAQEANGTYIKAGSSEETIRAIKNAFSRYKKVVKASKDYTNYQLYYQYLGVIALILLVLESLLLSSFKRKKSTNTWVKK